MSQGLLVVAERSTLRWDGRSNSRGCVSVGSPLSYNRPSFGSMASLVAPIRMEIARSRYARGEISREEFERLREHLMEDL
jgi:hypothetical protein